MLPPGELFHQIDVEIDSLKGIAAAMRENLEQGLRTQVPAVHDAMQPGATIGGQIAGGEWVRLQNTYSRCIEETLTAVYGIDKGSQALAQAADLIAKRYGETDAFARASASDVDATLVVPSAANPLTPRATVEAQ
ncbi:hypothetical protein ACNTMW_31845 [Planosporangium sp. 12N6]|uniref:hypothetical protein n=1 Tax=Planosporangium spinosum TaxID=3402278 RepID=UPI003CF6CDFF